MGQHRLRRRAGVVLVIVVALALGVGSYIGAYQLRLNQTAATTSPSPTPTPTPSAVLHATDAPSAPVTGAVSAPSSAGIAAAVAAPLADKRLGGRVLLSVEDAATGAVVLDRGAATPAAPASTAKLATAAAVLLVRNPADRITTKVVAGSTPGTVVLVGGGDPTLTGAPAGQNGAYPDAARISDLATQITRTGAKPTRVVVDDGLFSGPDVSPGWDATDVPTDYGAAITAAMVDGGRNTPEATIRSADPAGAAGDGLAAALGLPASAVSMGAAPAGATQLAAVQSAPIEELVAQMLGESDNVIAEVLGRQVALAVGRPASFTGATAAIRTVLARVGVNLGSGMVDASGLAAGDRIAPAALTDLLATATGDSHPALHDLIAALPVAGWDGTLADRYTGSAAAGNVRAKTGTLTSVSALAGTVQDAGGALLVFAVIADQVGPSTADTDAAETALDGIASALAGCCR